MEVGGRAGRLRKVLSRGDTGGVVGWCGDLGSDSDNVTEAGGGSCGVPETGDEFKEKKAEGRLVEEGGHRQSA